MTFVLFTAGVAVVAVVAVLFVALLQILKDRQQHIEYLRQELDRERRSNRRRRFVLNLIRYDHIEWVTAATLADHDLSRIVTTLPMPNGTVSREDLLHHLGYPLNAL